MQVGGVEAGRDAETAAVGQDEFEGSGRVSSVMPDLDGHEGDGRSGRVGPAVALADGSPPGVEGRDGEALALAEGADGEAAPLPACDQVAPVLLLTGIAGLAG
jgi:hypothetical protein